MNVLNELESLLGPIYQLAVFLGAASMFGAPILAFLAVKGAFTKNFRHATSPGGILRVLGTVLSALSGLLWLGALLALFPGVLFCSVYCFLGLALPILGLGTGAACVFLLLSSAFSAQDASDGA